MQALIPIEATYIEASRSELDRNLYVEFKPPSGTNVETAKYSFIVVVDCSGSMQGRRIRKVNSILNSICQSEQTVSIDIIKFGSKVEGPYTEIAGKGLMNEIKANLGGTDFNIAMDRLLSTLKSRQKQSNLYVIFLSDGEAAHPTEFYEPVAQELKRLDAPLLSLAISNNVDPEIMVNLASLNGDLGLCLIQDCKSDEESLLAVSEFVPINTPIDKLTLTLKNASGSILNTIQLKYLRGSELVSAEINNVPVAEECLISGELEGRIYSLQLKSFEDSGSLKGNWEFVSNYVVSKSKMIMGLFLTKKISTEVARERVTQIRDLFQQKVSEELVIAEIQSKYAEKEDSTATQQDKQTLRSLKSLQKTLINTTRVHLNQCLDILASNDLRGALEAYSGKKVATKFNARMQQIAQRNKDRVVAGIDDEIIEKYLDSDSKPLAQCVYWLQNPLECTKEEINSLERGEWVGNGLLAQPGASAALTPWNIDNVVLTPVVITNTIIDQLKLSENDTRNRAFLKGFEGNFNASLPLISPEEHQGAVRLGCEFMRNTLPGQQYISKIFSNTSDLYDAAMPNALYVAATLGTLKQSRISLDFSLAFRSFLTLADQMYNSSPQHKPAFAYWESFRGDLLGHDKTIEEFREAKESLQGIDLISSKEPTHLPNICRAFLSLTCCNGAYETDIEEIKRVFRQLFTRLIVEQSSQKYQLANLLGVTKSDLESQISEMIAHSASGRIEVPKVEMGANKEETKVFWKNLAFMFEIHNSIRSYLTANGLKFSQFIDELLSGRINLGVGKELFQSAKEAVGKGLDRLVQVLFDDEDPNKVIRLLFIKACEGHTQASLPNHDGSDLKRVLSSFTTVKELELEVTTIFDRYIKRIFASVCFKAQILLKKKKKVLRYINEARAFNQHFRLESLEFEFQDHTLSFSIEHRAFANRQQMFNCLTRFSVDEKYLAELESKPPKFFDEFDAELWIKNHRNYIPGFSLYYKQNITRSSTKEEFIHFMTQDLTTHYLGDSEKPKRDFTPAMQEFLPIFAGHFWEERLLMNEIQKLKTDGLQAQDIIKHIFEHSQEIKQLSGERLEARLRHVNYLVDRLLSLS